VDTVGLDKVLNDPQIIFDCFMKVLTLFLDLELGTAIPYFVY